MAIESVVQKILDQFCSKRKLERDAALEFLNRTLSKDEAGREKNEFVEKLETELAHIFDSLSQPEERTLENWELRHGALTVGCCLVSNGKASKTLVSLLQSESSKLLNDPETRVRLAAANSIGELCKSCGSSVYTAVKPVVLENIRESLVRQTAEKRASDESDESWGGYDAGEVLHDTAGWRSLETSMKCLQLIVEGCGPEFVPHINDQIFDLLTTTLCHLNRFVRETGFYLLSALISCGTSESLAADTNNILQSRGLIGEWLAEGLADNWSQVRLASSVATRNMLKLMEVHREAEDILSSLVPPMCLNRYYLAEGVRLYSQESWRLLTKHEGGGIALVARLIEEVCAYYIEQTRADNHAVREASCHAIAELAAKIETGTLSSQVVKLLEALVICFQDDSWPVRDAACLASARFLAVYPESGKEQLETLLPLFWSQLEDCIPSVRQGAAESIATLCSSYDAQVFDWILPKLTAGLKKINDQPADSEDLGQSERFSGFVSGPATFGVAMRLRANDPHVHTGQEMYSCGSLAPKMRAGGCSDHSFRRPPTPWETTDGCIQLLAELSVVIPKRKSELSQLFPGVVEACRKRDFIHHVHFMETFCRRLPQLVRGLGKMQFKPHLQSVFEPLFYSLNCGCELTKVAAENCLRELAKIFGPSIIRGRIEMLNNLSWLDQYDRLSPSL